MTPARDGIFVTVGCPNCHTPEGASPMRIVDTIDAAHRPTQWRRSLLECVTCGHGALIEINLINVDQPHQSSRRAA